MSDVPAADIDVEAIRARAAVGQPAVGYPISNAETLALLDAYEAVRFERDAAFGEVGLLRATMLVSADNCEQAYAERDRLRGALDAVKAVHLDAALFAGGETAPTTRGERVAREALMRAVTGDYDQVCGVCEECAVKIVDAILELGGSAPRLGASV